MRVQLNLFDTAPEFEEWTFADLRAWVESLFEGFAEGDFAGSPCMERRKRKAEVNVNLGRYTPSTKGGARYIGVNYSNLNGGGCVGAGCPCDTLEKAESCIRSYMEKCGMTA